jgi:Flp pilus assembly protein TadD
LAQQNLRLINAARAEHAADRLAAAGRLEEASAQYGDALALDAKRLHARAARGIILMRRGRLAEAAADLRIAFDAGVKDTEVANALAFALMQTGRSAEAVPVLKTAVARHPEDLNLAHNLARLLATAPEPRARDGALALRMALEIRGRTGGRDPRVLDTLAAAYAATGRFDLARQTAAQAVSLARQLGDLETADQIAAHARGYGAR